jgi:hypothetical protein
LRDEEHLTWSDGSAEPFECQGTIRGAKINANAELRLSHPTRPGPSLLHPHLVFDLPPTI